MCHICEYRAKHNLPLVKCPELIAKESWTEIKENTQLKMTQISGD